MEVAESVSILVGCLTIDTAETIVVGWTSVNSVVAAAAAT